MGGWKEISSSVLKYDYCCGCGVCAGVCPQNALEIRFNENGEYRPYLIGRCTDCGLCSKVCPFVDGNPNEDALARAQFASIPGIRHTSETGYYLDCFVGYSAVDGHREHGSSGGLATWTLEMLLRLGEVDCVVCVKPRFGKHPLFEFTCCRTPEEIRACSRSSYYPLEISSIVRRILSEQKLYAVIGLPCVCKALRLCAQASPRLRDRIKYVVGLTCGHGVSSDFSEYVFAMAGGHVEELRSITFRMKDPHRPTGDFGICLTGTNADGEYRRNITWAQGPSYAFMNRYFTPLACDLCDDAFAECADATFMDAWLPEYSHDPKGFSVVLTRHPRIRSIMEENAQTECLLQPIDISRAIESQKGALKSKRENLPARRRLFELSTDGRIPNHARERIARKDYLRSLIVRAQWGIARQSPVLWNRAGRQIGRFRRNIRTLQLRSLWLARLNKVRSILRMHIRSIMNSFQGRKNSTGS